MSSSENDADRMVPNFRVALRSTISTKKKPLVYRSSRLDALPSEKVSILRSNYGVKTILDLRSDREIDLTPRSALNQYYLPIVLNPKKDPKVRNVSPKQSKPDPLIDPGERLILSVIGARSFFTLLGELSNFLLKVLAIFCLFSDYIFRTRLLHRFIMKRILNSMGLENFNFFLLDHCQREIGTALHVFTESSRFPILVNCSQGKDRTGLIVALLQLLSGEYTHDEIVENYSQSYELLKGEEVLKEVTDKYYLNEDWTKSEPETMRHIIQYIDTKYNSLAEYMKLCGVNNQEQEAIKLNVNGAGKQTSTTDLDADPTMPSNVTVQIEDFSQGLTDNSEDQVLLGIDKCELKIMRPTSSMVASSVVTDEDKKSNTGSTNNLAAHTLNSETRDNDVTNGFASDHDNKDKTQLINEENPSYNTSSSGDSKAVTKEITVELVPDSESVDISTEA